jgi:hypothetical protein
MSGVIHRASDVGDDWPEILAELTRAFEVARASAIEETSFVYVVRQDDLLGRRGPGNAMVATGLLSAARTAALEGTRKGWTANVLAVDAEADPALVNEWAQLLLDTDGVTGELVRLGPGHIGKALP